MFLRVFTSYNDGVSADFELHGARNLIGPDSKPFNVMDVFDGIIESATLVSFHVLFSRIIGI